jgi:hypothetical protein
VVVGCVIGDPTLCGRAIAALKSEALLNESVGTGYIDRNWPPALVGSGAWPIFSLRQSFLNGSLTRLMDPDRVLRGKIYEFVEKGEFGLGSGQKPEGSYERVWFREMIGSEEVSFESGVFFLEKATAERLKRQPLSRPETTTPVSPETKPEPPGPGQIEIPSGEEPGSTPTRTTIRLTGSLPPEVWNRVGTKLIPKLRFGEGLQINVGFSVSVPSEQAPVFIADFQQILIDLGLAGKVRIE